MTSHYLSSHTDNVAVPYGHFRLRLTVSLRSASPGSSASAFTLSSLQTLAFSKNAKDRQVFRFYTDLSLNRTLPAINCPTSTHEAALFVFVLRSVNLADTPDWVHLPISKLSRCHVGASSALVLLRVPAPSLYTQKGNWCDKFLSICKIMRSKPRTRFR